MRSYEKNNSSVGGISPINRQDLGWRGIISLIWTQFSRLVGKFFCLCQKNLTNFHFYQNGGRSFTKIFSVEWGNGRPPSKKYCLFKAAIFDFKFSRVLFFITSYEVGNFFPAYRGIIFPYEQPLRYFIFSFRSRKKKKRNNNFPNSWKSNWKESKLLLCNLEPCFVIIILWFLILFKM